MKKHLTILKSSFLSISILTCFISFGMEESESELKDRNTTFLLNL